MRRSRTAAVILAALVLAGGAAPLAAHPFHVSIAEAEFNAESGKLEVALRVRPEDLERALRRPGQPRVDLERTANVDQLVTAYLKRHFTLKNGGQRQPLTWVGKEVDLRFAWLYFEFPAADGPQSAEIACSVLIDVLPDQVNTVLLRHGARRASIRCNRQQPTQAITWETQGTR